MCKYWQETSVMLFGDDMISYIVDMHQLKIKLVNQLQLPNTR